MRSLLRNLFLLYRGSADAFAQLQTRQPLPGIVKSVTLIIVTSSMFLSATVALTGLFEPLFIPWFVAPLYFAFFLTVAMTGFYLAYTMLNTIAIKFVGGKRIRPVWLVNAVCMPVVGMMLTALMLPGMQNIAVGIGVYIVALQLRGLTVVYEGKGAVSIGFAILLPLIGGYASFVLDRLSRAFV